MALSYPRDKKSRGQYLGTADITKFCSLSDNTLRQYKLQHGWCSTFPLSQRSLVGVRFILQLLYLQFIINLLQCNRSPSGGWWARPKTWKSNTAVAAIGMVVTLGAIWKVSADKEWRHREPTRWIPSMMWSKQFKTGEFKQD
ncbi:hypothetical protein INT43_006792 [Umbelopsis isabellina]|uniref:Uncharacterized protein n=1 Tax=Mortierella isabellina TaxID=91625 RepID=A0A8H7Q341_MORIS|nr:hypothetical protein INT43_006792 [Umbelopsis isabellina]